MGISLTEHLANAAKAAKRLMHGGGGDRNPLVKMPKNTPAEIEFGWGESLIFKGAAHQTLLTNVRADAQNMRVWAGSDVSVSEHQRYDHEFAEPVIRRYMGYLPEAHRAGMVDQYIEGLYHMGEAVMVNTPHAAKTFAVGLAGVHNLSQSLLGPERAAKIRDVKTRLMATPNTDQSPLKAALTQHTHFQIAPASAAMDAATPA